MYRKNAVTLSAGIFLVMTMVTACTTLGTPPDAAPYIQAAVDIAVATAETKGVSSVQINRVAKLALAADAGTGATLAAIAQVVNTEIASLNLPPADLAGVQLLEAALTAAIQAKIGSNPDLAKAQAAVAEVLRDVIAATGG